VLEALSVSGRLGLARREGNRRYYDLTERLFPADLLAERIPHKEQTRHKLLSRYRGHGLLGSGGSGELWPGTGSAATRAEMRRELLDRGEIVAVTVEGVRGERFVVGDEWPLLAQAEREVAAGAIVGSPGEASPGCSFLAPLDPLMWDRGILEPLYDFEYRWEVYTPAAKRRWGYYVLPILFGDRLVGRIEPRIDRTAKAVRILGLIWERGFDPLEAPGFIAAFCDALEAYLAFGGAGTLIAPIGAAHRPVFRAVGEQVRVGPAPVAPKSPRARGVSSGSAGLD
jgi:hypothetical protein